MHPYANTTSNQNTNSNSNYHQQQQNQQQYNTAPYSHHCPPGPASFQQKPQQAPQQQWHHSSPAPQAQQTQQHQQGHNILPGSQNQQQQSQPQQQPLYNNPQEQQQQQQQQFSAAAFVQPVFFTPVPVQFQQHQQQVESGVASSGSPQQQHHQPDHQKASYRWEPYARRGSNASSSTPGSSLNASMNQDFVLSPTKQHASPSSTTAGPTALTVVGKPGLTLLSVSTSVNSGMNDEVRSESSDIVPNVIVRKGRKTRAAATAGAAPYSIGESSGSSSGSSSDVDDDAPLTTPAFTEGRDLVLAYRSYGIGEKQHSSTSNNNSKSPLLHILRQQVSVKALRNMLKFCVNPNFCMMGVVENPNATTALPVIDELCYQYRGNIVVELVALFPDHRLVAQLLQHLVHHFTALSEDPLGSSTLSRVYEVAPVFFRDQISAMVISNFVHCATHPHANFLVSKVIQVSLKTDASNDVSSARSVLAHLTAVFSSATFQKQRFGHQNQQNAFLSLAEDKYGSHVLESWIECCPDASFFVMLQMLLEPVPSSLEELQDRQQVQKQPSESESTTTAGEGTRTAKKPRSGSSSTLFALSNSLLGNYPLQRVFRRMHRLAAVCGLASSAVASISSAEDSTESIPTGIAHLRCASSSSSSTTTLVPEQLEQLRELINKSTTVVPKVIKHSLYCSQVLKAIKNKGSNKKLNPL